MPTIPHISNSKTGIKNSKSKYHQSKSTLKNAFAVKLSPQLLVTRKEAFCISL